MTLRSNPVTFAVAIGLGSLGLGFVLVPGLEPQTSVSGVVVSGLGALALVVGLAATLSWTTAEPSQTTTVERERLKPTPAPGDTFDERLAAVRPARLVAARYERDHGRDAIVEELRETTVDVLVHSRQLSPDEATRRLEDGSWTDDAVAAAFFTAESLEPETNAGLTQWLSDTVGDETAFERQVDRVTRELFHIVTEGRN